MFYELSFKLKIVFSFLCRVKPLKHTNAHTYEWDLKKPLLLPAITSWDHLSTLLKDMALLSSNTFSIPGIFLNIFAFSPSHYLFIQTGQ